MIAHTLHSVVGSFSYSLPSVSKAFKLGSFALSLLYEWLLHMPICHTSLKEAVDDATLISWIASATLYLLTSHC